MNKKSCSPAAMKPHISNIPTGFCDTVHQHLISQVSDYYLLCWQLAKILERFFFHFLIDNEELKRTVVICLLAVFNSGPSLLNKSQISGILKETKTD